MKSVQGKKYLGVLATVLVAFLVQSGILLAGDKSEEMPASDNRTNAETTNIAPESDHPVVIRHLALLEEGQTMLAHINLAVYALDLELGEAAKQNLLAASAIADRLEVRLPLLVSDTTIKVGKLSYEIEEETRDFYVPVSADVFLINGYDETFKKARLDKLAETDAKVIEVTVALDIREVQKALSAALSDVGRVEFRKARDTLDTIYENSISSESIMTNPLWTVHDNLVLAKNLIGEKNFDSARFALKHVETGLEKLEKNRPREEYANEVKAMKGELAELNIQLRKKDPNMLQQGEDQVSSWIAKVKHWFSLDEFYYID